MDGGRLRYSTCFFTCSTLLLLEAPLHDVKASSCPRVIIHKKVGDTVEFSSCLPTEGVTSAIWKYEGLLITDNDKIFPQNQFQGRLELNPTNFSLTVRRLTLQDSGDFSFVSEVDDNQRPTVFITLQVHEPITKQPILTINSTWHTLTNSCTVLLECNATSDSSATYNWTVRNQTLSGPTLQYTIRAQDGDTKFTCTSYNIVSEKSASKMVKCSNDLQEPVSSSSMVVPLIIGPVIGILLVILFPLLWYIKSKGLFCNRLTQSQTVNQDETQQQVYSSLLHGDGSVYETIRGSEDAGAGGQPNQYRNVTSPIRGKQTQFDRQEEETDVVPLLTEMVGGRLRCLTCFLTCSSVLLLGVCFNDVKASSCPRVIIHKKVGDTVEFSSCLSTEGVTTAKWIYGGLYIIDKDTIVPQNQFQGRLELNPTNFSLTVRRLTLQDSGDFSFVSEVDDNQRPTIFITLQVHEPITKPQILTINSTWHTLTNSCTVFLECNAITDSSATYNWTVRNQTLSGPKLQYTIRAQDGDTKFTCISNNIVSEKSASKIVKCSNETQQEKGPVNLILILGVAAGGCLMIVIIVGIAVVFCHCKPSEPGSDSNDLTVYADITEVASEDNMSMKPCSVYETIDNRVNTVTPGPQTVYDKIQLSRVRKASVSPYQEIS